MALIQMTERWFAEDWFEEAARHLDEQFETCPPLQKDRYLTLKHLCTLLNKKEPQVLDWLATHKKIHGVIVRQQLFVHPTKFNRFYMRKILRHIDKGFQKEALHIN